MDESPGIVARYQVQGIPTLLLFKEGKPTARQTGALPAHALTEWLDAQRARSRLNPPTTRRTSCEEPSPP